MSVRLTTQERERGRSKGVKVGKEGERGGNEDRKERKGEKRVGEGGEESRSAYKSWLSPHPITLPYEYIIMS